MRWPGWAVPLLGVTYAATYTLMPTSALDVVPVGKAGKLGKLGESAADAGQAARWADVPNKIRLQALANPQPQTTRRRSLRLTRKRKVMLLLTML